MYPSAMHSKCHQPGVSQTFTPCHTHARKCLINIIDVIEKQRNGLWSLVLC
jgi:hypothetical protein